MGAVEPNAQIHRRRPGVRRGEKLRIALRRFGVGKALAHAAARHWLTASRAGGNDFGHRIFKRVVKFVPGGRKAFDAVILKRIVRSGNHHPRHGLTDAG